MFLYRQLGDNMWRGLRELHIWSAAWSSNLMSGRLDAFFSLTLCHALVACILFAGALSFYAPLATSYHQLASLTAVIYWLFVLFILTLLTTTIQLVMRMVRVGSGELLQRYRRVGLILANPHPQPILEDYYARRRTSQNVAFNNSSGSNASSWSERLRRLIYPHKQINDNNDNNNNTNNNDNRSGIDGGVAETCSEVALSDAAVLPLLSGQNRTQRIRSPCSLLYGGNATTILNDECSNDFTSHEERTSEPELSVPPLPSSSSLTAACADNAGGEEVDGTTSSEVCSSWWQPGTAAEAASQLNANNNNSGKKDGSTVVSVPVKSPHHRHGANASTNAEAARRSRTPGMENVDRQQYSGKSSSAPKDKRDTAKYCSCEPVPASPCSSCCTPGVRPNTCWCRYPNTPFDDCSGWHDGRFRSLPSFPPKTSTINGYFKSSTPLPPTCGDTPDYERRNRFSSCRPCGCACPCDEQDAPDSGDDQEDSGDSAKAVTGGKQNRLGFSRSGNPPTTDRRGAVSRSSQTYSFNSPFSAGNMSRNNPAFRSNYSPPLPHHQRSFTHQAVANALNQSSAAFDVYWNRFWEQIAPNRDAVHFPSTLRNISLSELKPFTGHLIETVISRLKARYAQRAGRPSTSGSSRSGTGSARQEDTAAMCRHILREMIRSTDHIATKTKTRDRCSIRTYGLHFIFES